MTTQIMDDFQVETEKQALIKQALLETYYKDTDSSFLNSKYGKIDVEANVNNRYLSSLEFVVPWVSRQID